MVQHPVWPHTAPPEAGRDCVSAAEHETGSRESHCASVEEK